VSGLHLGAGGGGSKRIRAVESIEDRQVEGKEKFAVVVYLLQPKPEYKASNTFDKRMETFGFIYQALTAKKYPDFGWNHQSSMMLLNIPSGVQLQDLSSAISAALGSEDYKIIPKRKTKVMLRFCTLNQIQVLFQHARKGIDVKTECNESTYLDRISVIEICFLR
jgi:hypothetical protein